MQAKHEMKPTGNSNAAWAELGGWGNVAYLRIFENLAAGDLLPVWRRGVSLAHFVVVAASFHVLVCKNMSRQTAPTFTMS
eukprot:3437923-Karenia_brevis.AAC.1